MARSLNVFGVNPRWSPDGRWIAFKATFEAPSVLRILPAAGGRPRTLDATDSAGTWSPDSRRLAYMLENSLRTADLSGTRRTLQLGRVAVFDILGWSPDSRRIAFVGRSDSAGTAGVYAVGADGRGLRRLA